MLDTDEHAMARILGTDEHAMAHGRARWLAGGDDCSRDKRFWTDDGLAVHIEVDARRARQPRPNQADGEVDWVRADAAIVSSRWPSEGTAAALATAGPSGSLEFATETRSEATNERQSARRRALVDSKLNGRKDCLERRALTDDTGRW